MRISLADVKKREKTLPMAVVKIIPPVSSAAKQPHCPSSDRCDWLMPWGQSYYVTWPNLL
jgi:hypothetical protein